jgi:alpha-beta hydrolase superfamily lysophospholipase
MSSTIAETTARDGTRLRVREWAPASDPWAAMLVVHGLGEHSGRYEQLGDQAAAAGVAVRSFDLRGFGASGGRRGYVDRWSDYGDDVAGRLAYLRSIVPGAPTVLYGHSLGGLIVLDAVVRGIVRPDLVVLSAPALADRVAPWRRVGARLLGRIVPRLEVPNGLPGDGLSRDPAVAEDVAADPLNVSRSTVRLGAESFAAQRALGRRLRALDHLPAPTYVLHGSADPIVPVSASAGLARFPEVTRVVHPGLRHECHHELGAEAVIEAVLDWLRGSIRAAGVDSGQIEDRLRGAHAR